MIRSTFSILPSIGDATERSLWRRGILTWDDFLEARKVEGISYQRKRRLDDRLTEALEMLDEGNSRYFSRLLPSSEHWRLFPEFREDVACLDIETDGLGMDCMITVVGVDIRGRGSCLVRGKDLCPDSLAEQLREAKLLITFNGRSFDVPILEYNFPFSLPPIPHFDLRHAFSRLGYRGGLKRIERELGMSRPQEVEYVTGEEAIYLWRLWEEKGKENALNLLIRYNLEDTRNLIPLADHAYQVMSERLRGEQVG